MAVVEAMQKNTSWRTKRCVGKRLDELGAGCGSRDPIRRELDALDQGGGRVAHGSDEGKEVTCRYLTDKD